MKQGTLILEFSMLSFLLFSSNETLANTQVLIPAGEFKMGTAKGTRAEQPVHSIWVDSFFLDRYEVANKDYEKINPKFRRSQASSCNDCPATGVSWEEAKNYCEHRGMRLPTEAEWEKARRGPENVSFESQLKNARYGLPFKAGTAPVKSSTENGYGLHHMEGNVWEWTNDWFDEKYYNHSPKKNPQGPSQGFRKVVRGGSWYNNIWYLQAGMRFRLAPKVKLNSLGFRCAKNS